jgi:hypothetical protein
VLTHARPIHSIGENCVGRAKNRVVLSATLPFGFEVKFAAFNILEFGCPKCGDILALEVEIFLKKSPETEDCSVYVQAVGSSGSPGRNIEY